MYLDQKVNKEDMVFKVRLGRWVHKVPKVVRDQRGLKAQEV
jgi:hypothetical protein